MSWKPGFEYYGYKLKRGEDEVRPTEDFLEIRCKNKNCNNWVSPTREQIRERIRSIEGKHFGNHYIFCCDECKNNSSDFRKRSKMTEEQRKRISVAHVGQKAWNKGIKGYYFHSEETKLKISKANKGNSSWLKGKHYTHTEKTKQKLRISTIKYIEQQKLNGEPLCPRVGFKERPCLNELQKYTKYKIIRQYSSFRYKIGRFPDGYILELKLFILFDEFSHFEDEECMKYNKESIYETKDYKTINDHTLFRISEKEWKENKNKVILNFKELLTIISKQINIDKAM